MTREVPNLRVIAQRADVSIAAVSYVLNGKGRMSAKKRQDIQAMLLDAGYKPKNRRYPVLYLNDSLQYRDHNAFDPFLQKYEGLTAELDLHRAGLRVDFMQTGRSESFRAELRRLMEHRPGAVVLDSNLKAHIPTVTEFFQQHKIHVVQMGHIAHSPLADAVVIDNYQGTVLACEHLIRKGHRHIATIRWNADVDPASAEKHTAFTATLKQHGIALPAEYVQHTLPHRIGDEMAGRDAMNRLLALPTPPSAVYVENSFVSPSLMYPIAGEAQLPVALAAMEIVHFEAWHMDWIEQATANILNRTPRKTTLLRIDWKELARLAARQAVERLDGFAGAPQTMRLTPTLIAVDGENVRSIDMPRVPSITSVNTTPLPTQQA